MRILQINMRMMRIGNDNNSEGFSLIGLLVAVVIIAMLGYGGLFFYQEKKSKDIYKKAYEQAEEDIGEINKKVEEMNELIGETVKDKEEEKKDWEILEMENID